MRTVLFCVPCAVFGSLENVLPFHIDSYPCNDKPSHCNKDHNLYLHHSDDTEFRKGQKCDVCTERLDFRFGFYQCLDCPYSAHLRCETMMTEPFVSILNPARSYRETRSTDLLPEGERTHILSLLMAHRQPGLPKVEHKHKMVEDVPSINDELCNACVQPISLPPSRIYRCTDRQCNWVLHEMYHDELTLQIIFTLAFSLFFDDPKWREREFFSLFKCYVCHRLCNDYRYIWYSEQEEISDYVLYYSSKPSPHFGPFGPLTNSSKYKFFDAKCANLLWRVKHRAHPNHVLVLCPMKYGPCPCCLRVDDPGEFIYRCTKCSYNLHPKCALYPSTVRHRYDKHPLKLTFKPVNNLPPDDCFCEVCEMELNQRGWFYHCFECDQFFHIACIPSNDQFSNIKFGGKLKLDCHAHPLTFDRLFLERRCGHCNKIIDYNEDRIAFQCEVKDCKRYQIHWECASLLCINQHYSGSERENLVEAYDGYEERGKAHIEEVVEGKKDKKEKNGASTSSTTHI